LLILDEYWAAHPELVDIPIYYASSLAKKCMAVYQTFINSMNERIRSQIGYNNPFVFKHISNLKGIDHFEDIGPCVILASPGMMQSGLSRELFESWCSDKKNGCVIAGYCVEGTLAKTILSDPEEITAMNGQRLPMNLTVESVSFSAHADYKQTSGFIRALRPPHVVLVHGEANEMSRLKAALLREYEADPSHNIEVHNPRNTVSVELYFRGEKMAKVMGGLAVRRPEEGMAVSGILVKRNFNYHLLAPGDLSQYTDLTMSTVTQRQSIFYSGTLPLLQCILQHTAGDVEVVEGEGSGDKKKVIRAFGAIDVIYEPRLVTLEWIASPCNDMFADAVLAAVLQAESLDSPRYLPPATKADMMHFKECLIELLQDMFGEDAVPKLFSGDEVTVSVDGKQAVIQLASLEVVCDADTTLQRIVQTAVSKLHQSLIPLQFDRK
jgi:cleavage and polyadenylation specificity factor subunit 3